MDFGKAFTFVFDDPDWIKKILLVALISLIPIIGQIYLAGYGLLTAQRVIRHEARPLPDTEFGDCLMLGLKAIVIGFVYAIPVFLLVLPTIVSTVFISEGNSGSGGGEAIFAAILVCCNILIVLYAFVLAFAYPAAEANFLATGRLGSAFKLGEVWALIKAAPGAYLLVFLGAFIGSFIASLGAIACGVGVLVTSAYTIAFTGHLIGQAYNAAISNKALM